MVTDWSGQHLEVEVERVAHGGHCVARYDGRVIFVRHTLPGERVIVAVTEDGGGSFCRADAVRVLRAAPGRVAPPCPLAGPGKCGGCDWQHASGRQQRELKASVVAEQLQRLAGIDWRVEVEPLPGGLLGWRSRVRLVADSDGELGFRVHRSHHVLPLGEHGCAISVPGALDDVLAKSWKPGTEVEVARDHAGSNHVRSVDKAGRSWRSRQLHGGVAREKGAGREWTVSTDGFWQVHPAAADVLARAVGEWSRATPGAHAWDLYAGVGLFASVLAAQVGSQGSVRAVESSSRAVADGRRNLADLPQVHWTCQKVGRALDAPPESTPEVVVLDPPRKGAGRAVTELIAGSGASRVIYVACDPAALARDVALLTAGGYRLAAVRAFDSFPMTHHVECVALLEHS